MTDEPPSDPRSHDFIHSARRIEPPIISRWEAGDVVTIDRVGLHRADCTVLGGPDRDDFYAVMDQYHSLRLVRGEHLH
jgi:hypothetical protein